MSHNLVNIPQSPLDKTCTDCAACQRDDGTWYAQGYGPRRTPPPCSPLLRHIEEWAGVPEYRKSPLRTLTTPKKESSGVDAHSLRKKW